VIGEYERAFHGSQYAAMASTLNPTKKPRSGRRRSKTRRSPGASGSLRPGDGSAYPQTGGYGNYCVRAGVEPIAYPFGCGASSSLIWGSSQLSLTQAGHVLRSTVVADAPLCRVTDGGHGSLAPFVPCNGSAFCLAAFCLAGGPPGYGGDRRVGLVQRLRCSGGWITALGGQREATHECTGQRQGDSQQQPHPQAPGEKCPHAQVPFVVPREVLWRYPPCPGLTTSRAVIGSPGGYLR
jgi:hypothetical protein